MSNAENRDAIARAMGYTKVDHPKIGGPWWLKPDGTDFYSIDGSHPIPNTADAALDAFARLLPGWFWYKAIDQYGGFKPSARYMAEYSGLGERRFAEVPDTGDFKADLFALVVKALEARKA